ncbi:MAG: hypothetical protein CBD27_05185 [Rhodospirillaceae bacterium TMED167]|nr:hypothetical protein [Rhodospirillaceae bacterium]OUW28013.1 MAG: hypothetical protein CBD27_05185 [Rhodospirillaceae bacterium TMED167]
MDVQSRRALLTCDSNPNEMSDYLVSLGGRLTMEDHGTFDVRVTYVPDSCILNVTSLHSYLAALANFPEMTPELSGKTLLEDANNELVPRWVRVTLIGRPEAETVGSYRCLFQDNQPNWSNPALTAVVVEFEAA